MRFSPKPILHIMLISTLTTSGQAAEKNSSRAFL
ncbi:hypothetical protein N399_22125 [Bacillus licheniformis CG-B52]|nr:hypothetical protein MUY_004223 [Bacillus licheniformis WX-02]EQM25735.1 hypothetical protein N399_22125 [Bacillus licheniformis CG-B52]KUL12076.1 hypothetical protein LI17339_04925 [Bacillus licheniformis LMG 17339]